MALHMKHKSKTHKEHTLYNQLTFYMSVTCLKEKPACMLSCVCTYLVANASVSGSQTCWFVCLPYTQCQRMAIRMGHVYVLSVDDIKILLVHSMSQGLGLA